jgi:hypothetical protein
LDFIFIFVSFFESIYISTLFIFFFSKGLLPSHKYCEYEY